MDRRNLGLGLVVGGCLLIVLSLVMLFGPDATDSEAVSSTTTTELVPITSATTTTSLQPTTTTQPSTTTTIPMVSTAVRVAGFVGQFAAAIEQQDESFLLDSLHPEIIEGFGESECRLWIQTRVMALTDYFPISTPRGPSAGTLVSPGGTIEFENRYTVDVSFVFDGEPIEDTADFVVEDERIFFTGPCET